MRCPTQLWPLIAAGPRTWLTLTASPPRPTAMLTVSPIASASRRHTGRLSRDRSSCAVAAPASRTTPKPSR
ncbi:hypothetical protein ACFQQB_38500 [Nonomuraea rubra]|uniref:hypothetical protein n=1 Tax=Nonomuraea rubra TaxID=46180 RepID=UPI00361F82A2